MTTRLLVLGVWLAAATAAAQTPTPEPTPEAMPMPTPEGTLDAPASGDAVPGGPQVHGFITVRYFADDGKTRNFRSEHGYEVQYARINVEGNAHPLVRYFVSMEAADLKAFAPAPFREAYVIWSPKPTHPLLRRVTPELRAGRMRRPVGIDSFQDESQLLTTDRSLVAGYLGNDDPDTPAQDFRDIGIRMNALAGPIEAMALGMVNGNKGASPANNSQGPDPNDEKDVMGRLGMRFGEENGPFFLRAGVSSGSGRDSNNHTILDGVDMAYWHAASDVTLVAGPLHVQTEAVYGKRTYIDPVTGTAIDTATGGAAYVLVAYRFRGRTAPYFRYAYREWSMKGSDDDLRLPRDWTNETTIGVNVQIVKKRLTARAQYTARTGFTSPHPATLGTPTFNKNPHGLASASLQAEF